MSRRSRSLAFLATSLLALSAGCVQRELQIHSNPEGALVFLNDQEIGRTPVTRPFLFYGTYDVVLRMDGYETLKSKSLVLAPWWQWVPIDFFAELFPLTDREKLAFELKPTTRHTVSPEELLFRAAQLKEELPATQPATTKPSKRKSTTRK